MAIVDYKEILRATNGGLDIIAYYYPEAPHALDKTKPAFKIREERTASASIRKKMNVEVGEEIYCVTDFGGDQKERHAIQICMFEENIGFREACEKLGYQFGISGVNPTSQVIKPEMSFRDISAEETGSSDEFYYLEKPDEELLKKVFGPLVEAKHLQFCNLKQCSHYILYRKGKAMTFTATADCPIYVFDEGDWRKIYQPFNTDKGFKFTYSGNKPAKFVFGLDAIVTEFKRRKKNRNEAIAAGNLSEKERAEEWRPDCFIMSGGSDGVNMWSTNEHKEKRFPIWFNSESEILDPADKKTLDECCANIYYVADLDKTGIRQAIATGMKYLDIKLVFLPRDILGYRSSNGKAQKDFKDFIKLKCRPGKESAFSYLLESIVRSSMPMRFWYYNSKSGAYKIAHSQAFQFLSLNGIGKIEDKNLKEGFRFIHVDGNVVREIDPVKIENKLLSFLEERRMPIRLRDLFISSGQLSPKQLNKLSYINLDFQTTGKDFQYFFFKNKVLKVGPNSIEESRHGDGDIYAWEEKVMEFPYQKTQKAFTVKRDHNDDLDIEVHSGDCQFLNFLINTSRIHWKKELEDSFNNPVGKEALDYHRENKFNIAGSRLDPAEIQEQKLHLINKIYALGYLFHEYKVMNRALCIYAMDNKIGEQGESNGGSGKSLCFGQLKRFLNRKYIPSRNRKSVEDNQFVYDGVTEKTDYVLFDDAHRYFSIDFFFSEITDGMVVNPKHGTPFEVPFVKSPKFVVSTNHAPKLDRSTERRLLFTVFSDYYHKMLDGDTEYIQSRTVSDDFEGKQLFADWDDAEYNRFMNFIIECVQFYLRHPDKVDPPMGNVSKRNLLHEMQDTFVNWANEAFYREKDLDHHHYLDTMVDKQEMYKDFLEATGQLKAKYKISRFKKNVEHYCKYVGWKFCPRGYHTDKNNGRIMKDNKEHFFIETKEGVTGAAQLSEKEALEEMWNDNNR